MSLPHNNIPSVIFTIISFELLKQRRRLFLGIVKSLI